MITKDTITRIDDKSLMITISYKITSFYNNNKTIYLIFFFFLKRQNHLRGNYTFQGYGELKLPFLVIKNCLSAGKYDFLLLGSPDSLSTNKRKFYKNFYS